MCKKLILLLIVFGVLAGFSGVASADPNATVPYPADEATGLPVDVNLYWTPGDNVNDVNGQNFYFDSSFDDVNDANSTIHPSVTYLVYDGDVNDFDPPNSLDLGRTYYWRVDGINDANTWRGDVWSFTVLQPGIIVWDDKGVGSLWKTALNWDMDTEPNAVLRARIRLDDANECIIDATHTAGSAATAHSLKIGEKIGATVGPGELGMSGGVLDIVGAYNGDLVVGANDVGEFAMSGGTLTIADDLVIADDANSGGSLMTLTGGTVTADDFYVGDDDVGTFIMSSGTVTLADDLYIANDANSDGSLMTLTGGTVIVDDFYVGDDANGTLDVNMSSGSLTINDLTIADETTSVSTMTLTAGTVILDDAGDGDLDVGDNGVGTLNMSGGSLTISDDLHIADNAGSDGSSMTMTGGTFNVGGQIYVGDGGVGTFTISDGSINTTGDADAKIANNPPDGSTMTISGTGIVNLANNSLDVGEGAVGHLVIEDDGTLIVDGHVSIADKPGDDGCTMTMTGGTADFGGDLRVGDASLGTFDMNDGTLTIADDLIIADSVGSEGIMTLSGGTVTLSASSDDMEVGDNGVGTFIMTGGTLTIHSDGDDLKIADEVNSVGSMTLSNGIVILGAKLSIGDGGLATFTMEGGTLTIGDDIEVATESGSTGSSMTITGGEVTVGDELSIGEGGLGTFTMSGGTLTIVDDLYLVNSGDSAGSWMKMTGGTIVVGDDFRVGDDAYGYLDMNDGYITVGNDFEVENDSRVYLNGGTIEVLNDDDLHIDENCNIDIKEGTLILFGDEVSTVEGYVDNGRITGYGTARAVVIEYDSEDDKTTVTADASRLALAFNPDPAHNELDVPLNANLSWSPGKDMDDGNDYATHYVYLSMDWNDVNNGTFPGDTDYIVTGANDSDHADHTFAYGQTWYWRVDEVNDSDVVETKGDIWTFEVLYENIVDPNLVGWWKLDGDFNDSSGYKNHGEPVGDAGFATGVIGQALDLDGDGDAVRIPYKQRLVPKVDGINNEGDPYADFSISLWFYRDSWTGDTEEQTLFSHDGDDDGWVLRRDNDDDDIEFRTLGDGSDDMDTDFTSDPGEWVHIVATYAPNGVDDDTGVRYLYINGEFDNDEVDDYERPDLTTLDLYIGARSDSNNTGAEPTTCWPGMIDDVRLYIKVLSPAEVWDLFRERNRALAWRPNPRNGETGVVRDPNLSWSPGDYAPAGLHRVNLGDDPCSMSIIGTPGVNTIPAGLLELGKTYYWRVDEANGGGWDIGDEWHFTVTNHLVVDDMDSYTPWNIPDNNMWQVWMDGAGDCPGTNNTNSGAILYPESVTTYGGSAGSMKYVYDNDGTVQTNPCGSDPLTRPKYSRAVAQIADLPSGIDPNWLAVGARALALRFYGSDVWFNDPNEKMWVELTDDSGKSAKVTYGPPALGEDDINDVIDESWHQWNIDLQDFNDGGVDLAEVNSIAIGFGNIGETPSPGWGYGTMYIDDIRLYATRCVFNKRDPGFARVDYVQDCVVDAEELDVMFGDWLVSDYNLPTSDPGTGGLIGYWPFDADAQDVQGNATSVANGSPTYGEDGKLGKAISLDGTQDVTISNFHDINSPSELTIAMWVKPDVITSGNRFMWFTDEIDGSSIYGKIRCRINDGEWNWRNGESTSSGNIDVSAPATAGEWTHFAGTRKNNDKIELFINGESVGSEAFGVPGLQNGDGSIGSEGGDDKFDGLIDELRVYNFVLSSAQILYLLDETPLDGSFYIELTSPANAYPKAAGDEGVYNPANIDIIDFRDYAVVAERWLDKDMFPPEGSDD